jgi:hypothetical protein
MDPLHFDDDDDKAAGQSKRGTEFECPDCNAHNPVGDGFVDGGEVICYYCGMEFRVSESDGKFKFKAV